MSNETKNKDKAMAARMKAEGVKRTITRCPICHHTIALSSYYPHVTTCKG